MNTLSMTWDDLPDISMRAISGPDEQPLCAIRWRGNDCIVLLLLPHREVAIVMADPDVPEAAIRALGRSIALHQGAFVAGDFPTGEGAGVTWCPPVDISWGDKTVEKTHCILYQGTEIARLVMVSDPEMPKAVMQFKSIPSDDMWRTVARVLLQHRARLPRAGEGEL